MILNPRIQFVIISLFVLVITACQPTDPMKVVRPDSPELQQAQTAEQQGDYQTAGKRYLELASSAGSYLQAGYYLSAAQAFVQAQNIEQAITAFKAVNSELLTPRQKFDATLVETDIALFQKKAPSALSLLSQYSLNSLTQNQQTQYLERQIKAYALTDNKLEQAYAFLKLMPLLPPSEQVERQKEAWQTLMALPAETLDLFNPGIPPSTDSGWFSLAYLVKAYKDKPEAYEVALEDWLRNYPSHPADPTFYQKENVISAVSQVNSALPNKLNNIVILLPQSGPYAAVSEAIKKSIIAAHFTHKSSSKLHFLDANKETVWQRYQEAIELDAELVIGPLDKASIQVLADADHLAIPVLALNRLAKPIPVANLFQFGLSPEDDTMAAVRYASSKGFKRGLIISPNNNWGKRVATAFTKNWNNANGTILTHTSYSENKNDFSSILKAALGLKASERRYKSLQKASNKKLEYKPRPRQDIDFIFLVAKPLKARQMMTQLKFHHSGRLPIISTSHAYAGYQDRQQNIDLNGLIINDIPWLISPQQADQDPTYLSLKNNPASNFKYFIRLYALGADAYLLATQLNRLATEPNSTLLGATGRLSIDSDGIVHRSMRTTTFVNGKINPLSPQAK